MGLSLDASVVVQSLMHFLWQGAAVWAAATCLLWIVRPRQARPRDTRSIARRWPCWRLALGDHGCRCRQQNGDRDQSDGPVAVSLRSTAWRDGDHARARVCTTVVVASGEAWSGRDLGSWVSVGWLIAHQRGLLTVWLAGVVWCGLRLGVGAVRIWRLVRRGTPLPEELQRCVRATGGPLGLSYAAGGARGRRAFASRGGRLACGRSCCCRPAG